MKRVIALSGTTVEYDLTWKNVKNLNLRLVLPKERFYASDSHTTVGRHRNRSVRTNAQIQLDVFWAYNAGMDPLEIIEKYSRRIKTIHLKDGIAAKESESGKPEGRYVGSGNVAIKDIIKLASKKGILMIVESEDLKPNGETEIAACMDYLRREG